MKKYILIICFTIVAIITLPLFWLKLLQWAFLDETAIIAEGISLVGAILGGTISGTLTLVGVKLTIDYNEKERNLNTIPRKIMIAEDVISQLKEKKFAVYENVRWSVSNDIKTIIENNFQKTAEVNYRFYNASRKIYDTSIEYNRIISPLTWEEYAKIIEREITNMESELKKFKETINN